MKMLEYLVQAPLAQALGYALLHFVWEGAMVALLLAATLPSLRPGAARMRYAAASAALAVLLVLFAVTIWRCFPTPAAPYPLPVPAWIRLNPSAVGFGNALTAPSGWWAPFVPWLAPLWLAGVLLCWTRVLMAWLMAQRMRCTGTCLAALEWQARMQRIKQRMRISRPVVLLESCLAEVPVVIGWLRPAVLMPVGVFAGFPPDHIEAFLIHELAHIRRWDYLVNLTQSLVEGLLFYHPAVWWISGKVRAERENCCDDAVVVLTGDARGYAVALTAFEEKRWAAEAAVAANGGHLIRRIHRLLKPERPTVPAAPIVGLLLASAGLAMAAWKLLPSRIPPLQVAAGPGAAQAQALARQLESPYEKWLREDVAYIITESERAAFQRLQADAEREKFIEQFWLRRDPTPDTPRNEYKEEHYRRIAYTNDNFGFGETAGWRTDRGRIYIMFGPPDEREVHEKGGVSTQGKPVTLPFEIWRYRFIEGVGKDVYMEFVDAAHSGDYRMTRDPAAPAPK